MIWLTTEPQRKGSWDCVARARNKWADNKPESFAKRFSRGSETTNQLISNVLMPIFGLSASEIL